MRIQTWHKAYLATAGMVAFVALGAVAPVSAADQAQTIAATMPAGAGSSTAIKHWLIQSSGNAQEDGPTISVPGYSTSGWYPVSAHPTVMAGLLENGKFPHVFYGVNLRRVQVPDADGHAFVIPWWYRTTFDLSNSAPGLHTFIKINGIIPCADLWLNGHEIANHTSIAGAYTTATLDVTRLVHPGTNVLAVKVYPAEPQRDLALGWIDWNPAPPDNNMGVWRNIDVMRSGAISLRDLHVLSKLDMPDMQHAELTIKVQAHNNTASAEDTLISGQVAGASFERSVHLAAHQTRIVTFNPRNEPTLRIEHPKVWWPAEMGSQPLYHATLKASVDHALSDQAKTTFGIRDLHSVLTAQGYRQFVINGKPLLIRGGGWAPDMFLRDQPERLAAEFRYIRNLGLNAIRTEGKLERADFYRLADRQGILILAGWECCDKWEAWAKTGAAPWDKSDLGIAGESMTSEAQRLRDHPSVIAFLIGSDNAAPADVAKTYVDALRAADWPDPIITAASAQKTQVAGPSGMKMSGPYAWVPPNYWYSDKLGGAFGFNSETSAGIDIPGLDSLRAMLAPEDLRTLWQDPDVLQYHAAPLWSPFSSLKAFDTALAHRYGAPKSLSDFVEKSQLANYEAVRAQFEAYDAHMDASKPATGVTYWMFNNAWPSLHWHLISHDLNPAGAYFGAKKANEPVHIQYSYDDRAIMGINHTLVPVHDAHGRIRVCNLDGSVRYHKQLTGIDLAPNHATRLATIPSVTGLSSTYFVELDLMAADGHEISRNVYWLSSQPDRLNWAGSNWYMTPVSHYADLTALQQLPAATVSTSVHNQQQGTLGSTTVTVTAAADSKALALLVHLSIRQGDGGPAVLPVTWTDNDITLWPGESATLTAHYQITDKVSPAVKMSGWNVSPRILSASPH